MVTRDNGDGRQVDMFLRPEAPKHTPSLEQETLPSAVHRKPEVRAKFKELQGILDMPIAKILDLIPSTEIQQIPRVTLASIGLPQDISTQEQLERAKEEDEERPYVPRRTRPNAERPLDAHNTYEIRTPVAHVPSLKIIYFSLRSVDYVGVGYFGDGVAQELHAYPIRGSGEAGTVLTILEQAFKKEADKQSDQS